MRARTFTAFFAVALVGVWGSYAGLAQPAPASAAQKTADKAGGKAPANSPVPVDTNMHDFMEGVFQGPYKRLKTSMAEEPKDNAGWKAIRSEALILAEGGNLLILRKPGAAKEAEEWVKYSVATRDAGAELFKAAKAKDFAASKKAYGTMLNHCNACHQKFDEENHQLKP
jgi:hypothetical protein